MAKNKDIISEEEFNRQTRKMGRTEDSPSDSDFDSREEFLMGADYDPEEKDESQGATIFDASSPNRHDQVDNDNVPDSARVVSSDKPRPSDDKDSNSNTH